MKLRPRLIVELTFDHWNAWFEDRPIHTFGGDTPGTAVEWLRDAELNSRAVAVARLVR